MKLLIALAIASLAATACKGEKVAATVSCKVKAGPVVECSVDQTKGKSAIEVCWDFNVTCANGATLSAARSCGIVEDGQTANVTIGTDKLTQEGSCEGEVKAEVTKLKWSSK